MAENDVFILRGELYLTEGRGKRRDAYAVIITDKPYDDNFIKQAWDYAVKETSEKMKPAYAKAVIWLQSKHPEWQVKPCEVVREIEFDMGKQWGVTLYPPTTESIRPR